MARFFSRCDDLVAIGTAQMKDFLHIDKGVHQVGLADVARNPIEDQVIDIGQESMRVHTELNADAPKLDGNLVRHKLTFA